MSDDELVFGEDENYSINASVMLNRSMADEIETIAKRHRKKKSWVMRELMKLGLKVYRRQQVASVADEAREKTPSGPGGLKR